jgi:hypothetical protein
MPYLHDYNVDVLIAGGGVAGASAAIAAARKGLRVLLLESRQTLGGLATNGYVNGIAGMVEGICREWVEKMEAEGALIYTTRFPSFHPDKASLILERMVLQAGAKILYGVSVVGCSAENGSITEVFAYSRSGKMSFRAKVFIDSTGDAVLAAAAGVPCEVGSPEYGGLNMSSTLSFRISGVNHSRYVEASNAWAGDPELNPEGNRNLWFINYLERKAVADGDLPMFIFPSALMYRVPGTTAEDAELCVMTAHSVFCHNMDVEDVTRQIIEQHRQIEWLEKFFRKCVPGFESCRVSSIANMHGIRDSRRAMGEYVLKDTDVACCAKFEDGIARFPEAMDTHHPTNRELGFRRHANVSVPVDSPFCIPSPRHDEKMRPFVSSEGYDIYVDPSDYSEIPYRCIVPLQIDNLFVAGRCISAEFHAQAGVRVIAECMLTGQAAGIAAALCVRDGLSPRKVDGKAVREIMIRDGVELDKLPDGYWTETKGSAKALLERGGKVKILPGGDFVKIVDPAAESGQ